jgi:hypothetical protein
MAHAANKTGYVTPTLLLKADAKLDADVLFDSGEVSFLIGMELFNSPETINTST